MHGCFVFSFYKFFVRGASKFIYCEISKIWDYYNGLKLTKLTIPKMQVIDCPLR